MSIISVRQATLNDLSAIFDIFYETALWLKKHNIKLWRDKETSIRLLRPDIQLGLLYIAFYDNYPAGVIKLHIEDLVFWSDISYQNSFFIHRLAIQKNLARDLISIRLIDWAINYSHQLGKRYLRLNCDIERTDLSSTYIKFGLRHHSDIKIGSNFISRYEYEI